MMDLVKDIEQSNNAWAVGRFDLIASQAKLPDEISQKIPPVKWLAIAGHVNGGISAQLRAEANDDEAAQNLRGVLNGVISLARLQGQNDPKLTSLINSLQLTGDGKTVRLSFAVPAEIFELMHPKARRWCSKFGARFSRLAFESGRLMISRPFSFVQLPVSRFSLSEPRAPSEPSREPCAFSRPPCTLLPRVTRG